MYNRGKSKDEEKQNKMERYVAQITSTGKKKCIFRETCATVPMERSAVPL